MRPLSIFMFIACLAFCSCKPDNMNPANAKSTSANTLTLSPADPTGHVPIIGIWKWSAQYDFGAYQGDLLNPANTGITETLNLAADSTWTQTQNGKIVNTGTYHLINAVTPGGPMTFLRLVNVNQPNAQITDNFDFGNGFGDSYTCSSDSLILYGGVNTPQYTNLATKRIYVK